MQTQIANGDIDIKKFRKIVFNDGIEKDISDNEKKYHHLNDGWLSLKKRLKQYPLTYDGAGNLQEKEHVSLDGRKCYILKQPGAKHMPSLLILYQFNDDTVYVHGLRIKPVNS